MKRFLALLAAFGFLAGSAASAQIIISEFMAKNNTSLLDEDGSREDWVEIYNAGTNPVNLLNWSLTDNPANLFKWRFPSTNIAPGQFIVVFASNKNRRTAGAQLHTNFKLEDGGEFLALVKPDGSVAMQFSPTYPQQAANVSYGVGFNVTTFNVLTSGAPAKLLVPRDGTLGTNWIDPGFGDGSWSNVTTGVGFDVTPAGTALAPIGLVADSVAEFSGVQGQGGWFYGFYNRTADGNALYEPDFDFNTMDANWGFSGGNWVLGAGGDLNANPPWTTIGSSSWHPNGVNNAAEHWAVRRWVSPMSGPLHIVGSLIHPANSDGTRLHIFVDGTEVGLFSAARSTNEWALNTTVRAGQRVDFALDAGPVASDGADSTTVTFKIYQGLIADSVLDWTTTGFGSARGWSYGTWFTNSAGAYSIGIMTNHARQIGNNTPTAANHWNGVQFMSPTADGQPMQSQLFMHPFKTNAAPGALTNKVYFPVRRYQFSAQDAGLVRIYGTFANTNRAAAAIADGVNYTILVDGVQILNRTINNISEPFSFVRRVSPGSIVDFISNARGASTNDATYFTAAIQKIPETLQIATDSMFDWIGTATQGYSGWSYGYYNKTLDGDGLYNPETDFTTNNGFTTNWTFTGGTWQLGTNGNAGVNPPWTFVGQVSMHPHGTNSAFADPVPQQEHWAIRRWMSDIAGPVSVSWRAAKQGFGGGGVTALLLQNGIERDRVVLAGTDFTGSNRVAELTLAVGDKIEFVLTPVGPGGSGDDSSDQTQITGVIWSQCGSSRLAPLADSRADWSYAGEQGHRNWFYGYYNLTTDASPGYGTNDFTPFFRANGVPFGANNFWTGSAWDWFSGNPPWNFIGVLDSHPNGTNNTSELWSIRRWVATTSGDLRVNWWLAKANLAGNGVSGHVFHNGALKDTTALYGTDFVGTYRSVVIANVQAGDFIDFAHTPRGATDLGDDGSDGSYFQASIYAAGGISSFVDSDISGQMYNSNATTFLRVPFTVADPSEYQSLKLRMRYDDGFVAWLNGFEVARRNAPSLASPARVADSTNDWSSGGIQGVNGWYYGYYTKATAVGAAYDAESGFNTSDLNWTFGAGWALGPGDPPWTQVSQTTWHPNGSNNTTEQWAIRRWVPGVGGRFTARVTFAKGSSGGNGTSLRVFLNGTPIFFRTVAGTDTAGFTTTLSFAANAGDKLDFALDALGTDLSAADGSDNSTFGCLIDRLPSGDLEWNSTATGAGGTAGLAEEIDISSFRDLLNAGPNVLAIQGLNIHASDPDFYLLPEITAAAVAIDTNAIGYFVSSTAGKINGASTTNLGPVIESTTHFPPEPFTNETILVTATIQPTLDPVAGAVLYYRLMYGAETNLVMFDDGAHGDGAAGDGVWGVTIPGGFGLAGQMIRWRIVAADTTGDTGRSPLFDNPFNSPEYWGTVYRDTNIVTKLPVLHWFVQNPAAANTAGGTRSSIFFRGQFRDNVGANLHGQSSSGFIKKSYDFDLGRGFGMKWDDDQPEIDDFNLLTTWADKTQMRNMLAYEAYVHDDAPGHYAFALRVHQNAAFHSTANWVENGDANYLQRIGLDDNGALYKMYNTASTASGNEKKTRKTEPFTDLQNLINGAQLADLNARARFLWDNLDVPATLNMLATHAVISDHDCCHKNYYLYRDTLGSGEWTGLPWDVDLSFGHIWNASNNYFDDSTLTNTALFIGNNNIVFSAMYANPQMRQIFLRRLRTLMDAMIGGDTNSPAAAFFQQRIDAHAAMMQPDVTEDLIKSGTWNHNAGGTRITQTDGIVFTTNTARLTNEFLHGRRAFLYHNQSVANGGEIPTQQPADAYVGLWRWEVSPAGGNQEQEWIALTNFNSYAVDISRWQLDGAVRFSFKAGTVIPASTVLYVSPNAAQFRARAASPKGNEGLYVTGPYEGHLSARGEPLTLADAGGRLVASNYVAGTPTAAQLYLRITEIMYNPPAGGAFGAQEYEFLELRNISAVSPVDLTGVKLSEGVTFNFIASSPVTNLAPGQRVVLVKNQGAFVARHGFGITIAGQYTGSLDNAGERLRLLDASNEEILDFEYNNSWYPTTDGLGYSLRIVDELAQPDRWNDRDNWQPSGGLNGTPGLGDTAPVPQYAVVVSEVLAHTDLPDIDYIELHNLAATNADISGWFISDDEFEPKKFVIPPGTIILAGGFVTFYETNFNTGPNAFSFGSDGDEAFIFSGDAVNLTGYTSGFDFGASANGVPFSRHVNSEGEARFVASSARTENAANAYPLVGPVTISEIMYHPPDQIDLHFGTDNSFGEFVELHNTAVTNVALFDPANPGNTWRLRGDADFDFPAGVTLAADERVLLVSFDPISEPGPAGMFRMTYNVPASTRLFGPWDSKLDNGGGEITLTRPDAPNVDGVPRILVEEVAYGDQAPWPKGADGFGLSLHRVSETGFANDATNWIAAPTTAAAAAPAGNPPVFTLLPISQVVTAGVSVTFSAAVSGDAPISWQWRRNGDAIPGATNDTLNMAVAGPGDAGDYDVLAWNAAGSVLSPDATLSVAVPATIVSQPLGLSLVINSNGIMGVVAVSSGTLGYQWRKGGIDVPDATNDTLAIVNAQLSDAAGYTVVVCDPIRCVTSSVAQVGVAKSAGISFAGYVSAADGNFRSNTVAKPFDGDTNAVYGSAGWIFYGTNPQLGNAGGGSCTATGDPLTFDNGVYRTLRALPSWVTLVNNGQNQVCGNFGYSPINEPTQAPGPAVTNFESGVALRASIVRGVEADVVNIRIGAGSPSAFRIGVVFQGGGGGDSLNLTRLRQTAGFGFNNVISNRSVTAGLVIGFYDVTNAHELDVFTLSLAKLAGQTGNDNLPYTGLVFDELTLPNIVTQPVDRVVNETSNVTFTVGATGPAPLRYRWTFNGSTIVADSTNASLTLSNVSVSAQGAYQVLVYNAVGEMLSASATLTVNDITPPVFTMCPGPGSVQCLADVPAPSLVFVAATDARDPNPVLAYAGDVVTGICPKTVTRTYTATDNQTNVAMCVQVFTVQDTVQPMITCPPSLNVTCNSEVPAANPVSVLVTDNCDPAPVVIHVGDVASGVNPTVITRTWRATDFCGNSNICTQTITVEDNVAPVITTCAPDLTVDADTNTCAKTNLNLGLPAASDNCSVTLSNNAPAAIPVGTNVITWTARDERGNTATCLQTVIVRDITPPVISAQPTNLLVNVGDTADFAVTASGCTALQYQWCHGTNDLPGETNSSLSLPGVIFSQAGGYSVKITNVGGSVTSVVAVLTVNRLPVALVNGASVLQGRTATIAVAKLLLNDSDADGDLLTVTGVSAMSTNGGSVTLSSGFVFYTPLPAFFGHDLFTYTVSDGRGGTATGNVEMFVANGSLPGANQITIQVLPGGHVLIRFAGVPGRSYQVQRSPDMAAWTTLATVPAPAHGIIEFVDAAPPVGAAFYRIALP